MSRNKLSLPSLSTFEPSLGLSVLSVLIMRTLPGDVLISVMGYIRVMLDFVANISKFLLFRVAMR